MNSEVNKIGWELEAQVVGSEFKPGVAFNLRVARFLGMETKTAELPAVAPRGKTKREVHGLVLEPGAVEWRPCPAYGEDTALLAECIERLGHVGYHRATLAGGNVVVFDHAGEVCVTVEFKNEAHAFAAALSFLLDQQSVTGDLQ